MNVSTANKQIIFVDASVQNYQNLIEGADVKAKIVVLDDKHSGIEQITNALAAQKDIKAVHILSHGSEGSLQLGTDALNENNLENFSDRLKQWGNALTQNADILLYGCEVAKGKAGKNFIQRLSEIADANIAASANPTGSAQLGGDWELEVKLGEIETAVAFNSNALSAYSHILATANPDNKALPVNSPAVSIDVLANDTGSGRVKVQSITTAPTNGTAIINDWIYVGGYFTSVSGQPRNRIARLNSDGTLDSTFNPNANSDVQAILIDNSGNPYISGAFVTIGGQTRSNIAKLNPITGAADATFNANANGNIQAIAFDSSGNLIVAGYFNIIGGQFRNRVAKLNPITGAVDATFNPNADWNVEALVLDSSGNPYITGQFTTIGGTPRNYIAKLNPTTGAADVTFDPNANSRVDTIA
ncbi:MAG: DUF4347 domain-containing protein, partial [Microcoleus sp. SU_5_6]|nr:DUF4347 domain-containing protein [Microcoleus sp. SU_5_6]